MGFEGFIAAELAELTRFAGVAGVASGLVQRQPATCAASGQRREPAALDVARFVTVALAVLAASVDTAHRNNLTRPIHRTALFNHADARPA